MSSPEAKNENLVRQLFEGAFLEDNLDIIDEIVAEDFVGHSNLVPEPIRGPEEYKEFMARTSAGMSNVEYTFEDVITTDDKVVVRARATATHDGEFMGIEPTGQEIEIEGMYIARIEGDRIVESWGQNDLLGALKQLGVVELPGE